jgi:hypothetical protein
MVAARGRDPGLGWGGGGRRRGSTTSICEELKRDSVEDEATAVVENEFSLWIPVVVLGIRPLLQLRTRGGSNQMKMFVRREGGGEQV